MGIEDKRKKAKNQGGGLGLGSQGRLHGSNLSSNYSG